MKILQIISDVLLVLIMALSVFWGIKRGFVKSFFKSIKLILVILVTIIIGSMVASVCQNTFVDGMIEGKISNKLVAQAQQGEELDFETIKNGVPGIVKNIVPMDEIEEYHAGLSGDNVEVAQAVGEKIENVLISIISNVVGYVLAFIISFILCTVLIFLLDKFFELPVLNGLNRIAGIIWGVACGYLSASTIAWIIALAFGRGFVNGTVVTDFVYNIGLFSF